MVTDFDPIRTVDMDMRDFFAAMAASGSALTTDPISWSYESVAKDAYAVADAMMEERDRTRGK